MNVSKTLYGILERFEHEKNNGRNCKMVSEKVLIRKENIGYILYSFEKNCYLFPSINGKRVVETLVNNITNKKFIFSGINSEIQKELISIGIDDNVRYLDNTRLTDRLLSVPLEYYFDYTNRCNLRCPHCYNMKHLGTVTMPPRVVEEIIKEMYRLGVMRIHLAGGEPTIDPIGLKNYLKTAYENSIVTSMATNGLLLDDTICDLIIEYKLFAVSISLDGYDEKSNAKIRGTGNFLKACEGIKRLIHKRNVSDSKTEIALKPTYTSETNLDFFEKMIHLAIKLGVDKIKFANPERSLNHDKGHYGKSVSKYYAIMKHIANMQWKYRNKIKVTNITNPVVGCPPIGIPGLGGCIGGQELLTINPDGRITPCLMNDTKLGNYYEYGSVENFLVNSSTLNQYLERINNQSCTSCNLYRNCRGGCQVRKLVEHGNIEAVDPYCPKINNCSLDTEYLSRHNQLFYEIIVAHSL